MKAAPERTLTWQVLLGHALEIIDSVTPLAGTALEYWTLVGGTMLMRRYHHRLSKDIDIFLPDGQGLAFLSPRLNRAAEDKTSEYVEQAGFLKLYFAEGEIDFVLAGPLTPNPFSLEFVFGRDVRVETPAEIIGKKVEYRASQLKARDLFDLACVVEKDSEALLPIRAVLARAKPTLLGQLKTRENQLREDFLAIDRLDYEPSFDEAAASVRNFLAGVS
jgi:hypothetical protein